MLGAGVFRIGSSVEFDWCGVNTIWALKKNGIKEAIMVNYNPETVSTDYDVSDKLYFEELTIERILDIYEKENPLGIITSVGGQIPNNLSMPLCECRRKNLGHLRRRRGFGRRPLQIQRTPRPTWTFLSPAGANSNPSMKPNGSQQKIGYPVIVRPSYVLSGSAMRVAYNEASLENFLNLAAKVSRDHPVVISKFINRAKEVEVDGVSDGENVLHRRHNGARGKRRRPQRRRNHDYSASSA